MICERGLEFGIILIHVSTVMGILYKLWESTGFYRNYRGGCGRIGSRFGRKVVFCGGRV